MGDIRDRRARIAADIPAVVDVVKDLPFPLASLHLDAKTRSVVLPFERKHPRRESWELVIRGVGSLVEDGRLQQATDYFRGLTHDAKAGTLTLEAVLVQARMKVDGLDVEARCVTAEAPTGFDVTDLPAEMRKEIEEQGTARVQMHDRYEQADRERVLSMAVLGAIASLLLGLLAGPPWWWLAAHGAAGAGIGRWMALKRWQAIPAGAAALGMPNAMLAVIGCLLAGRSLSQEMGFALIVASLGGAVAGAVLALLHTRMLDRVEEYAFRGPGAGPSSK